MAKPFPWKAAISAGIVAGLVFMLLEMALVGTIGGQSPWGPPRMIAAIAMGDGVLPPPATFDLGIVMVAMIVHFALSMILGVIFGWAISRRPMTLTVAIIAGIILGLAVYVLGFYILTPIFPWFAMARGGISIFAHAVFGLTLGLAYYAMASRQPSAGAVE